MALHFEKKILVAEREIYFSRLEVIQNENWDCFECQEAVVTEDQSLVSAIALFLHFLAEKYPERGSVRGETGSGFQHLNKVAIGLEVELI